MTAVMPRSLLMSLMRDRMESVVAGSRAVRGFVAEQHLRDWWPGHGRWPRAASGRRRAAPDRNPCGWQGPPDPAAPSARLRGLDLVHADKLQRKADVLAPPCDCMSRLNCWKIMPMERRAARSSLSDRRHMSLPSKKMEPPVGRSSMLMQRTSVLLPAPLLPMTPKMSPLLMARLMP